MTCNFPQWHKEVASKRVLWILRKRRSCCLLPLLKWCQIAWIGPSECSETREFANTISQSHSQMSKEWAKKWCSECTEIISAWSKYFPLCKLTLPNSRGFVSDYFSRGWRFWLYHPCSLCMWWSFVKGKVWVCQVPVSAYFSGPVSAWYEEGISSSTHPVRRCRNYLWGAEKISAFLLSFLPPLYYSQG